MMKISSIALAAALGGCTTAPTLFVGTAPTPGPPVASVGGFSLDIPDVPLAPGEEIPSYCKIFPLEVAGPSRFVAGGRITVGPGLHHGNIYARNATGTGVRDCGPNDGDHLALFFDVMKGNATVLFGSSTQHEGQEWQSFPNGMAFDLKDVGEIVVNLHFFNATPHPITVAPRYEWFTVDPATVEHELAPFIWHWNSLAIAPQTDTTVLGN